MELMPILLISGVLYSAGSYALFALVPRHSHAATRAACGMGLFLLCTTALFGHLYLAHLTWREIDAAEKLVVERVHRLGLDSRPDLLLADVRSYRSRRHCVSIDVVQGAYHDLGRELTFVGADNSNGGLLHFLDDGYGPRRVRYTVVTTTPDASRRETVRIDCGRRYLAKESVKWLQNPRRLLYPASSPDSQQGYLCIADTTGRLLQRYEVRRDAHSFLLGPANRILTLAPTKQNTGRMPSQEVGVEEAPYLMIDADANTVVRFGLPGLPFAFSGDLRRAICARQRIQDGRRYQSYVLVELPSLSDRPGYLFQRFQSGVNHPLVPVLEVGRRRGYVLVIPKLPKCLLVRPSLPRLQLQSKDLRELGFLLLAEILFAGEPEVLGLRQAVVVSSISFRCSPRRTLLTVFVASCMT